MKKYAIITIILTLLGSLWWYFPRTKIVEVTVPIEDISVYDDLARLAMLQGQDEIAKQYIDKSGNETLLAQYQHHLVMKEKVLGLIDQGLNMEHSVTKNEVFKRLLSVESLEDEKQQNLEVVMLLLLARISATHGFESWDRIADVLQKTSAQLEGKDSKFSALLFEISQEDINV